MKLWFYKKLGITPDILKEAEESVLAAEQRAKKLPYHVNGRQVLILLPRDKFFEWKEQWDSFHKSIQGTEDRARETWYNARSYLIPYIESERELGGFIKKHRKYFIYSFVEGHVPKSRWPWVPDESEFPEWFDYHVPDWGPWDMDSSPLSKSPDDLTAMDSEL